MLLLLLVLLLLLLLLLMACVVLIMIQLDGSEVVNGRMAIGLFEGPALSIKTRLKVFRVFILQRILIAKNTIKTENQTGINSERERKRERQRNTESICEKDSTSRNRKYWLSEK